MAVKISGMTAGDVADLVAATSDIEVSNLVGTVPVTRRYTFAQLASWFFAYGRSAPTAVAFADSPYAVLAGDTQLLVDTSGGAVTVTLPTTPPNGRVLGVKKVTTDANLLTIGRNTRNIEGVASNLTTASTLRPSFTLQYQTSLLGWWIL